MLSVKEISVIKQMRAGNSQPVEFTAEMIEAIYAAWHGAGVDIAGGNWKQFVGMSLMQKIKLIPKTNKGKKKIFEAGTDEWFIDKEAGAVLFSQMPGPWILVSPNSTAAGKDRWVHKTHDTDFIVSLAP